MKKPNLFIVGFPKSGTTSLHFCLNQHPDIFMCEPKEPSHFCKDFYYESLQFHKRRIYKFRFAEQNDYLKLFTKAKNKKVVGEATSIYIYSRVAAKEIHDFNPTSKIIIMIREPVGLLYSSHSQLYLRTAEDVEDFEQALDLEESRREGRNIPLTVDYPSLLFYSDRVKYSKHIRRYMKYFDNSNLKIMIFESFVANIQIEYVDILRFLELNPEHMPDFTIHNPNEKPRSIILNRISYNSQMIHGILNSLPPSLSSKIVSLGKKFLFQTAPRETLDPAFKRRLMQRFKSDVCETSDLLGIDLVTMWGYHRI